MVVVEVVQHVVASARRQRHCHQRMPLGTRRNTTTAAAATAAATAVAASAVFMVALPFLFAVAFGVAGSCWRFVDKFACVRTFSVLHMSR